MLAVAKANGLDLDVVNIDFSNITEEHRAANKQGKVPTFIGSDGFVLTECIALAIYSTFVPSLAFPFLGTSGLRFPRAQNDEEIILQLSLSEQFLC